MPELTDPREPDMVPGEPTGAFTPVFDTGGFAAVDSDPIKPLAAEPEPDITGTSEAWSEPGAYVDDAHSEPLPPPANPLVVPSTYHYLKRWRFVLVVAGTWLAAAAVGLGLFYWWYHSVDKTWPVFAVLTYVVVCTVASLIAAMVPDKPLVSALSIALMSAPFASMAAAASLYGAYFFEWIARPS